MLSEETQRLLGKVLIAFADGEREAERLRVELANEEIRATEHEYVGLVGGPHVSFQRINRNGDNLLTPDEIIGFLAENGITDVTKDEALYVVNFFDCDRDSKLTYDE